MVNYAETQIWAKFGLLKKPWDRFEGEPVIRRANENANWK